MNLGNKLSELRLNISSGAIGMYESGKRTPSLNKAIEIAEIFNIPVEKIQFTSQCQKTDLHLCKSDTVKSP